LATFEFWGYALNWRALGAYPKINLEHILKLILWLGKAPEAFADF
jgi:hypothetical protein